MMNSVKKMIWILVLTLLRNVRCQDGYNDQNMLRAQQVVNDGQIEANAGFNSLNNDPNNQGALSTRYQMPENSANFEFNRESSKPRKVYRIKNPFQNQQEDSQDSVNSQDSDTSASNQYAGMQYSLPPEEFLQQMRAENQYQQQQQQQQQQLSTQASVYSYTSTPQPQYLYSTMTASYVNQPNQNLQETKALNYYNPNVNSFQFNNANNYGLDASVSTPAPQYLSTSSNQYMGTPANTYISSPSPMYITNPPNLQPSYVSSPYSNTQAGTVDYNTNKVSTVSQNVPYDSNNIYNKKIQVDNYSNSGNAIRYSDNVQYQNYPSSTSSPVSSPYSEETRDNWGNAATNYNNGVLHKSTQDMLIAQYSTNPHYRVANQEEYKHDVNYDTVNQDAQRYNTLNANNNIFYSYSQPHNQANNLKSHSREVDQQIGQTYSHGDYGWKLDRKPQFGSDMSTTGYSGYQNNNAKSDNEAISQVSFQMDTSKPYNYNQISKSSSEKLEAEDFIRAATKAHENYKQQQELNRISNLQYNNNAYTNTDSLNSYYANSERNKNKPEHSNSNAYINGNTQPEYVTASPYYARENYLENKPKQVFDHDKAIKNIVPIDVSNVVQNSNTQLKSSIGIDSNDKYSNNKDQYNRPTSETYYKDKNNVYTFSIKSQPEDYQSLSDRLKQLDLSPQQGKSSDTFLGYNSLTNNKRYVDDTLQSNIYGNQNPSNSDNHQLSGNIQQSSLQRSQIPTDLAALLKFNDIPLRLIQQLNPESSRLPGNNFDIGNLPNPLPVKLNQNIEQHHVDVGSDIISKILAARQNSNKQEPDVQNNNQLSTIHGFKVANPFNIDLKLVSDMLKGKPAFDESQLSSINQYSKPVPIKFDLQQIQQLLLKNDNGNSLSSLGVIPSSYFDMYSNGRYPYQGVKYSRSEEEPENIPIAESSNSHLIGAVVEEIGQDTTDVTETDDDVETNNDEDRPLKLFNTHHRMVGERFRHTNNLGRHMYQRKFPKTTIDQPHPVLKPPHKSRSKIHSSDKINRKRRINKPKHLRFFKTEPLFEANTPLEDTQPAVSTLLKPPPVMEDKSDVVDEEQSAMEDTT